jgi:hypothetical protein
MLKNSKRATDNFQPTPSGRDNRQPVSQTLLKEAAESIDIMYLKHTSEDKLKKKIYETQIKKTRIALERQKRKLLEKPRSPSPLLLSDDVIPSENSLETDAFSQPDTSVALVADALCDLDLQEPPLFKLFKLSVPNLPDKQLMENMLDLWRANVHYQLTLHKILKAFYATGADNKNMEMIDTCIALEDKQLEYMTQYFGERRRAWKHMQEGSLIANK